MADPVIVGGATLGTAARIDAATASGKRNKRPNRYILVGGTLVLVLAALSLLAPLLAPADPNALGSGSPLLPLGAPDHFLGTDMLGRDQLSRMLYGGRITLLAGFSAAILSAVFGVGLGMVAGFLRGPVDSVIMRVLDVLMSFPFILLAILIVAFAGPSVFHALLAIAIANVPFLARVIRGETLRVREYEFVMAATALGASRSRILLRHVLPNVLPLVLSVLFVNVGWMISQTSALSFLGLGAQPPTADWGTMLAEAQSYMALNGGVAMIPGLMIVLAVVGFNLFGLGLKQILLPEGGSR
ncbi:MAG: ABC transporter permease [Dermatophilaceae bacterium]